jgi:tetratricopeptide (TPR) repeat protein
VVVLVRINEPANLPTLPIPTENLLESLQLIDSATASLKVQSIILRRPRECHIAPTRQANSQQRGAPLTQVFKHATVITFALLLCASRAAGQENNSWTDFSNKVKNGLTSLSGTLTPKPRNEPADNPTSLSSKSKAGPELHVAMARLCEARQSMAEAAEQFRLALAEDPQYLPALVGFARLHVRAGELDEATRLYEAAAKAAPKEAAVFNDLGLCYAQRGMFPKSIAALDEAIRLQPATVLFRNNAAMVLVDTGQIDAAYSHLAAVHCEAAAHYNLGYLLVKKGQNAEAARQFAICVQHDPSLVQAQQWLQHLQTLPANSAAVPVRPAPSPQPPLQTNMPPSFPGAAVRSWTMSPAQPAVSGPWRPEADANHQAGVMPPRDGPLPPVTADPSGPGPNNAASQPPDPGVTRHKIYRLPTLGADAASSPAADPPMPPQIESGPQIGSPR